MASLQVHAQNVDVTLSVVAGTEAPLTAPFVDFDLLFTDTVTGLEVADFAIGGTAAATLSSLSTITEGSVYQLRVTSFSQAGDLSVQLPAGVVDGPLPGSVNNASALVQLTYAPPIEDDLAPLSDEFNDSATLSNWLRNDTIEGWNADKLEVWDIDTSASEAMRLMPYSSSWYQDFTGAYTYKEVTGDFILTIDLDVMNRAGTGRPSEEFSLAGIMIRSSRGLTNAAPVPDPGPGVVLPWPPDGSYTSPWQPHTENYIFLSYGFGSLGLTWPDASNPNRWHYEVKTTINGVSTLYPRTFGVPENEPNATLQVVRRGSTFLLLRRHGPSEPWIVENRFVRTDMPATLQVGITTYTDWQTVSAGWDFLSVIEPFHQNRIDNVGVGTPDLIADVDYYRLRRPDSLLSEGDLASVAVTGSSGPLVYLDDTALAPFLGDAAAAPVPPLVPTFEQWLGETLPPEALANPEATAPGGYVFDSSIPNILYYLFGGESEYFPELLPFDDGAGSTNLRYVVPRDPSTTGWRIVVETNTDLTEDWIEVAVSENGALPTGIGFEGEMPGSFPRMIVGPDPSEEEGERRFYRIFAEPVP